MTQAFQASFLLARRASTGVPPVEREGRRPSQGTKNKHAELLSHPGKSTEAGGATTLTGPGGDGTTLVNLNEAVYIRLHAKYYMLQSWCSLSFDDHRGLESTLKNIPDGLTAVLSVRNSRTRQGVGEEARLAGRP